MEKDNNLALSTILSYYTEGFDTELILHIVSIMNEARNFNSNFEYSFKIGNENVFVTFDCNCSCLSIDIKKEDDDLIIKKRHHSMQFIRYTKDGNFKACVNFENGKPSITTEEIGCAKLELK